MAALAPPTALVDVELGAEPRRGVPLAVTVRNAEPDVADTGEHGAGDAAGDCGDDGAERERAEPVLGPHADRIGVDATWLTAAGMTGATGKVHDVALPGSRPAVGWVLGLGDSTERDYRRAGAALIKAADGRAAADGKEGRRPARSLQVALPAEVSAEQVAAFTLGAVLASYDFRVTAQDRPPLTRTVTLLGPAELEPAVRRALVLARATALTRDLANMPSNTKDPAWLAGTAARLAAAVPGLTARVRDVPWLRARGFGGVLAVGGGSARPPRLLELSWRPRGSAVGPHLALVGKGITFDTGGISIKPALNMHVMRTDMAGGGAVIAALIAIAQLRLPLRVTGLVPMAENHVSGSAYRPGDVVRHVDGRTTAVTNTDAEGRIVLADGLGYAVRTLRPDLIVDVATLTGAMRIALGWRTGGFFATDDELAERLMAAGERAGEAWWRMPLGFDMVELDTGYAEKVHSARADVEQCPVGPGAIAAALFLREFTGGVPWAHLDVAGAARSEKAYDDVTVGATGFAARTLVELASSVAGSTPPRTPARS
ncbi:MAG TPA: leucyl aminopeptidase family protein [Pseudonocardiaceae bacterium]